MTVAVTIIAGNSDNKLTQSQWCDFCNEIHKEILACQGYIHFSAHSVGWADWQNSCWVFIVPDDILLMFLKEKIRTIGEKYNQDSVAWIFGNTEFI